MRESGVILFDNTLWHGEVIQPNTSDPRAKAIRELNNKLIADKRVEVVILPVADGLTLARKR
jgi:caffeoyl-CoA O-methyltransferase